MSDLSGLTHKSQGWSLERSCSSNPYFIKIGPLEASGFEAPLSAGDTAGHKERGALKCLIRLSTVCEKVIYADCASVRRVSQALCGHYKLRARRGRKGPMPCLPRRPKRVRTADPERVVHAYRPAVLPGTAGPGTAEADSLRHKQGVEAKNP